MRKGRRQADVAPIDKPNPETALAEPFTSEDWRIEALKGLKSHFADEATKNGARVEYRLTPGGVHCDIYGKESDGTDSIQRISALDDDTFNKYVEEADRTEYVTNTMSETAAFIAAAAENGLSTEELRKAIDAFKAAKGELTERNTTRARAAPRPKWENRKSADAQLTPPEFIAKHYAEEMAAGRLHRGLIAQEDKPLAVKLANWLRTHDMPENMDIPTKPEWMSRRIAEFGASPRAVRTEEGRLHEAARYRARSAKRHHTKVM